MPMVIKSCDIDKLCDEWKLYVAENIDETTVSAEVSSGSITRIDAYWFAEQKIRNSASITNVLRVLQDASSKYKAYLEDCKKEKSELDSKSKRKDGVGRLENLKKEEKTLQEVIQASYCLIGDANKKISAACKSKNMQEIFVAQALLEAGHKQLTEKTAALKKVKEVESCYFAKKLKK
ncbi:hypothetical protein PR048_016870 [Dryococelus australis]|uniref:Uncharacterized protein n=1 Tax=Dryococelus australis TaxID=614101 RepID=A0ABQ9H833_9NEOP|nr:hypothetical protein PR048_016870 [Dryococelus australis]